MAGIEIRTLQCSEKIQVLIMDLALERNGQCTCVRLSTGLEFSTEVKQELSTS